MSESSTTTDHQGDEVSGALSSSSSYATICCLAISCMLFRLSIDLIQTASQNTTKDYTEDHHNATVKQKIAVKSYGSTAETKSPEDVGATNSGDAVAKVEAAAVEEGDSEQEKTTLLSFPHDHEDPSARRNLLLDSSKPATWSFRFQCVLLFLLVISGIFHVNQVVPSGLLWSSVVVVTFGALLTYRDIDRQRFGIVARTFYLVAALTIAVPLSTCYYHHRHDTASGDELIVNVMSLYVLLALGESFFLALPLKTSREDRLSFNSTTSSPAKQKRRLSGAAILMLLKPYFWPEGTTESAAMNRIRAIMTWVCVILSKVCNLISPILVRLERVESVPRLPSAIKMILITSVLWDS
jgi:hypothetical protein